MKVGFVGIGRMGQAMCRRLLESGHDLAVYDSVPEQIVAVVAAGAKAMGSLGEVARYGDVVVTMLPDDAALDAVTVQPGGLLESLPPGGIHICAGTHTVAIMQKLNALHGEVGQVLIATPMLGRPEVVAAGAAGMVLGGPADSLAQCRPLFAAIAGRIVEAGADPAGAAVIKIANNFVLGCAIEAMGEGFALVRKYGVAPEVLHKVMSEGLFACWAYKTYGQLIIEERYLPAGQRAVLGLKDANSALAAAGAVGVPLPSGNVWRDRLVGAVAHGEGEYDWAVMARDQARASGLSK